MNTYSSLRVCSLDATAHSRTCGYWFTVSDRASAHIAFRTRAALDKWLTDRGLALAEELPAKGVMGGAAIIGTYRQQMHMSYDSFYAQSGPRIRALSNGDYTLAIVSSDSDGIRTVHTLNPNCRDRPIFPSVESRSLEDAGMNDVAPPRAW